MSADDLVKQEGYRAFGKLDEVVNCKDDVRVNSLATFERPHKVDIYELPWPTDFDGLQWRSHAQDAEVVGLAAWALFAVAADVAGQVWPVVASAD